MLNETLRNAAVGSWAARYTDHDIELGGYKILQKVRLNTNAIFNIHNSFDLHFADAGILKIQHRQR